MKTINVNKILTIQLKTLKHAKNKHLQWFSIIIPQDSSRKATQTLLPMRIPGKVCKISSNEQLFWEKSNFSEKTVQKID